MAKPAFKLIEELFHEALALPVDQRTAYLDGACAGDGELRSAVDALLREDQPNSSLTGPVALAAAQFRAEAPTLRMRPNGSAIVALPEIPGYEVLDELGHGGMGVVYKVRQTNLNRIVALKMLLPADPRAPEMLARFRTEVEVWRVSTGVRADVCCPRRHGITHAQLDAEGRRVAVIDSAGAVQVLDTVTSQTLTPPLRHGGPAQSAAFCAGNQVITIGQRGTVSDWELPDRDKARQEASLDTRSVADLIAASQILANGRIDEQQKWQAFK
jgi:hypothetical protein